MKVGLTDGTGRGSTRSFSSIRTRTGRSWLRSGHDHWRLHKGPDEARRPNHILLSVTSSVSTQFFDGQLRYLQEHGWIVTLAASADVPGQLEDFAKSEGIVVRPFPLARDIRLWQDARALARAVKLFMKERPTISNVGTPKAGLIMGVAAAITRVPVRIYTLHGLRLETTTGWKRRVLKIAEMLAMAAAHRVVCVSPSLRDEVIKLGLANESKVVVIGAGSINGVVIPATPAIRRPRGKDRPVIGFVGRLSHDKGVEDLVAAFKLVTKVFPDASLLLIGSLDETDPLSATSVAAIAADSAIFLVGHVSDVSPYYRQMDVLALPTYREGLGSVLLEGAAHGLPTVATRVTGCRDGFVSGVTGWAVSAGNPDELADALLLCVSDPDEADARGRAGRAWVIANFSRETVWECWNQFYRASSEIKVAFRD